MVEWEEDEGKWWANESAAKNPGHVMIRIVAVLAVFLVESQ